MCKGWFVVVANWVRLVAVVSDLGCVGGVSDLDGGVRDVASLRWWVFAINWLVRFHVVAISLR